MTPLVFPNVGEYHLDLGENRTASWRRSELRMHAASSRSAHLWGGSKKVVVNYGTMTRRAQAIDDFLGYSTKWIRVPYVSGLLSVDCSLDDAVTRTLLKECRRGDLNLVPYGPTWQLHALADDVGLSRLDEPPPRASTLLSLRRLESKTGFREAHSELWDSCVPALPSAVVIDGVTDLRAAIEAWVFEYEVVVVKCNRGAGGYYQLRLDRAASPDDVDRAFEMLRRWPSSLVLVEQHVDVRDVAGRPTAIFRSTPDGLSLGGIIEHERVGTPSTTASGVQLSPASNRDLAMIPRGFGESEIDRRIADYGRAWSTHLASLGYFGWFDVDFLIDNAGSLWVTELNCRRSSGTHLTEMVTAGAPTPIQMPSVAISSQLSAQLERRAVVRCTTPLGAATVLAPRPPTRGVLPGALAMLHDDQSRAAMTLDEFVL